MHDDVGTVVDRLEQDRGCNRIVHDQRDAMPMSSGRKRLNIANIAGRIADAFAEYGAGVFVD